jgi:hypothetical protein
MKKYTQTYLDKAHRKSFGNLQQIRESKMCGCFFCTKIFPVSEFPDGWLPETNKNEATVQCPYCCIDAILGDASGFPVTDPAFIQALEQTWFGGRNPT